jgi:hypothetical protein
MSEQPFKSEFLRTMQARGFIHQITHPVELDAAAESGTDRRLHRLRCHRGLAARGPPDPGDDAATAAAGRATSRSW